MNKYTTLIFICLLGLQAYSQSHISLYHFEPVGQSIMVNPAGKQDYRLVIGVPALNNYSMSITNTAFAPNDFLLKGSDVNSDLSTIIGNMVPEDRFYASLVTDVLFAGFQWGRSYWSFGIQHNSQINLQYPTELIQLLYFGNNNPSMPIDQVNISQLNINGLSYHTAHLGYQRTFMEEQLRIGARLKLYSGIANLNVDRFNLNINAPTNGDPWSLSTDIQLRTAGLIGFTNDVPEFGASTFGLTKNLGYGVDLGANYNITPKWEVSATVLDLGQITWKDNTSKQVSNGGFSWDGVQQNFPNNGNASFQNTVDSLIATIQFSETKDEEYVTKMPAHYIFATRYQLTKRHAFGLVYQLNTWENAKSFSNYGITYTGHILSWLKIMANYNSIGGIANNVGVGMVLKGGPVQFLLMTDNVLALTNIGSSATTSFRIGLNIALNKREEKANPVSPIEQPVVVPTTEGSNENKSEESTN